jgi:hypothetical protein
VGSEMLLPGLAFVVGLHETPLGARFYLVCCSSPISPSSPHQTKPQQQAERDSGKVGRSRYRMALVRFLTPCISR